MGQFASKKKGEGQEGQSTGKGEKAVHKSKDAKEDLIQFMKENYDDMFKDVKNFDDFYHAIYKMIEKFCSQRGQIQYDIPDSKELKTAYEDVQRRKGKNLTKEEFIELTEKIVRPGSFNFGQAAIDVLLVLFGVPACALLAKRFVPGLKSLSDDVVIPAATSGAVVYLAKANKL